MSSSRNNNPSASSSVEIVPILPPRISESEHSEPSAKTPADATSVSKMAAKASTGPRTSLGKERSKHNALKHGIFSSVALLKDESRKAFDSLLNGLRGYLKPEGVLEDVLVEKLATLLWRQHRVLVAEGAEISKSSVILEPCKKEEVHATKIRVVFGESDQNDSDILDDVDDADALDKSLKALGEMHASIRRDGLCPEKDKDILRKLLKDSGTEEFEIEGGWPQIVVPWYAKNGAPQNGGGHKGSSIPEDSRKRALSLVDSKLRQLRGLRKKQKAGERIRRENEKLRQRIPDNPSAERLLRYETTLERIFDRTLTQLERIQRMRKGQMVPPPLKVDVSS